MLIPCSVAMIRGAPNSAEGRKLVDSLISQRVERLLAESDARHVPVREALRAELKMTWPAESVMDYDAVVDAMAASETAVREVLIR